MKHLKTKLFAAVAMLVVSAVMLTGVSYAWFTLSTNPEVTSIKANLAANENLEIALDDGYANGDAVDEASEFTTDVAGSKTGDPYTWGNLVDLTVAMTTLNGTASAATPKLVLAPVKYEDATLKYPEYGKDGRVDNVDNALTGKEISDYTGKGSSGGVLAYIQEDGTTTTYDALSVTYWLKSNEKCSVSLSEETERAKSANDTSGDEEDVNGVIGNGSYIAFYTKDSENTGEGSESGKTILDDYLENFVIRFDYTDSTGEKSIFAALTKLNKAPTGGTDDSFVGTDPTDWAWYQLAFTSTQGGSADSTTIDLEDDEALKVTMWIYVDGEKLSNEDALLDDCDMKLNIQFLSDEITDDADGAYTPGAMNGTTAS